MTMTEKLRIHREIEMENREHFEDFMMGLAYERMTADEIRAELSEMDARQEYTEQFGFLMELLARK